jgi:hypothetical protein
MIPLLSAAFQDVLKDTLNGRVRQIVNQKREAFGVSRQRYAKELGYAMSEYPFGPSNLYSSPCVEVTEIAGSRFLLVPILPYVHDFPNFIHICNIFSQKSVFLLSYRFFSNIYKPHKHFTSILKT